MTFIVKRIARVALRCAALLLVTPPALASEVRESSFGQLPDGRVVKAITLSNQHGIAATVITWGARLQGLLMPDREDKRADVQLGYDSLEGYLTKSEYFGATVGRCANRIAQGRFTLDGHTYSHDNQQEPSAAGFDAIMFGDWLA